MITITVFGTYRGYEIGGKPVVGPPSIDGTWRACWKAKGDLKWTEGCILVDDEKDADRLARQCVDYKYRVEVWEQLEGRTYDPMKDGNIPPFEEPVKP